MVTQVYSINDFLCGKNRTMKKLLVIVVSFVALNVQAQEDVNIAYVDSLFGQLPEVMVIGERPVVKAQQGKLVYDMPRLLEQLPVSNAYDALKELPGVIEQEGGLSLGGREVSVIINGKVSTMSKEQLKILLESVPADRLDKTEVMYAAPARYGIRGAMINVVLKETIGQKPAWSGEVQGTFQKDSHESGKGQGVLLYTSSHFSLDAMVGYSDSRTRNLFEKTSWHTVDNQLHELTLDTRGGGRGKRWDYRLGMDFSLGKQHQLGVVYNGNHRMGYDRTEMLGTATSDRLTEGTRTLHNVKTDYQSSFGLSAGVDFLFYTSPTEEKIHSTLQGEEAVYDNRNNQRINRWLFYVHQEHALKNGTGLNYGVQYTTTHDNTYQFYLDPTTGEPIPENSLRDLRKEYTLNMYVGASHSFGKWLSGEVSMATELYDARERHSWHLYPTMNLTCQPADGHTLQLSFTSECIYPNYWQMQALVQYMDSYTEVHGNPSLKPFSNYTLNLNYLWKNKYMVGLQYQDNPGSFFQLPYQVPDRLAEVNQFVNFDFRRSWMLQLMASYQVGKWWNGRVFAIGLLSHDKLDDFHQIGFNRQRLSAVLTTSNTFILSRKPDLVANLSGRYQSAAIQGFYDICPMGSIDASIQWTSTNGKAKVILKGTDLFQTSSPHTEIDWEGQRMDRSIDFDNRKVSLTFIYKLGGYKEKKREAVDTSRMGR